MKLVQLVMLKKALWLQLYVAAKHLRSFSLYLCPRCLHCAQKVKFSRPVSGVSFSTLGDLGSERRALHKTEEKWHDDSTVDVTLKKEESLLTS